MKKRTVLITGASSGIGYEFAKIFAKEKNNLILVARNLKRLEEIRAELNGEDINITIIEKDLSLAHAAEEVYDELKNSNQRVDVLVNNAGFGLQGNFDELNLQQQLNMMKLNMMALTELTRRFVPDQRKRILSK